MRHPPFKGAAAACKHYFFFRNLNTSTCSVVVAGIVVVAVALAGDAGTAASVDVGPLLWVSVGVVGWRGAADG